jgi:hypothetical protein
VYLGWWKWAGEGFGRCVGGVGRGSGEGEAFK